MLINMSKNGAFHTRNLFLKLENWPGNHIFSHLQNIVVVSSKNYIFHAYLSLLSLFVGLAPETNMVCLEIFFDIIVDDIWWFIMRLRPILAKIDQRRSKFTPCYLDNPHRKNSMSIWRTNMLKKGSINCLYMFEEHLML